MTAAPVMLQDRVYVGRKAIARRFGCSPKTLDRLIADDKLVTFRTGPAPSPVRARASEIERALKRLEGQE